MTAATDTGVGVRTPRTARAVKPAGARLLLIELRRSAMPLMLPLVAVLFWFDSYRFSAGQPAVWVLRTYWNMGQGNTIVDSGPFVAGVAAWMGSRERRRGTGDLVTATPRPRWAAQLATWAATAIWAVGAYLVFVAVMFEVYERQGMIGSPPWWWVAVGATAVAMFSAAGFAVGAFFPNRFAAPVAAFGGFLAMALSSQTEFSSQSGWGGDPADPLERQLRGGLGDLLPPAARPPDRPGDVPGRDRARGARTDRPAYRGRRAVATAGGRARGGVRGSGGWDRGLAGDHLAAQAEWRGDPRAARRGQ